MHETGHDHHHHDHDHGHDHETWDHPGEYATRELPIPTRDYTQRAFTVGVGGPVGTGKTALVLALCKGTCPRPPGISECK